MNEHRHHTMHRTVDCPTCGATAGNNCRLTYSEDYVPVREYHAARRRLAKERRELITPQPSSPA